MKHPATYSKGMVEMFATLLTQYSPRRPATILDPFAGVGTIHELRENRGPDMVPRYYTWGTEIEPTWAAMSQYTIVADATDIPWPDSYFDAIVTSPVYGNRMSDSHNARDGSVRRSYTHDLRSETQDAAYELAANNAGRMYAWQDAYWGLHEKVWAECARLLTDDGVVILNTSDFIRNGKVVEVTSPHIARWLELGFSVQARLTIETPRMRRGENAGLRVTHEDITVLVRNRELS